MPYQRRDLIEEYLVAKVWSLTSNWLPGAFTKVKLGGMKELVSYPTFGLAKPAGLTDEMIVEEVKHDAITLAGPYHWKE